MRTAIVSFLRTFLGFFACCEAPSGLGWVFNRRCPGTAQGIIDTMAFRTTLSQRCTAECRLAPRAVHSPKAVGTFFVVVESDSSDLLSVKLLSCCLVETDSTAAIGMCSPTGVGKTRHIQVRWLWIQDAIRDKVVCLKKVQGTENEADMGTKDLDGPTVQTASGLDRDSKRRKRRRSAGCR